MADFIEKIRVEWAVISGAPWSVSTLLVGALGLGWFFANQIYSGTITAKDATLETKQAQIDSYKEKLNGASPEETKAHIEASIEAETKPLKEKLDAANAELEKAKNAPRQSLPADVAAISEMKGHLDDTERQLNASNQQLASLGNKLKAAEQPSAPSPPPIPAIVYITNPRVVVGARTQGNPYVPLALTGAANGTFIQLLIAVDIGAPFESGHRIVIRTIGPVINQTTIQVPLIVSAVVKGEQQTLWWGDPSNAQPVPAIEYSNSPPSQLIRGRVAIIGPDNGEQYVNFGRMRITPQGDPAAFGQAELIDLSMLRGWVPRQ
jgi:hypothetical protein